MNSAMLWHVIFMICEINLAINISGAELQENDRQLHHFLVKRGHFAPVQSLLEVVC